MANGKPKRDYPYSGSHWNPAGAYRPTQNIWQSFLNNLRAAWGRGSSAGLSSPWGGQIGRWTAGAIPGGVGSQPGAGEQPGVGASGYYPTSDPARWSNWGVPNYQSTAGLGGTGALRSPLEQTILNMAKSNIAAWTGGGPAEQTEQPDYYDPWYGKGGLAVGGWAGYGRGAQVMGSGFETENVGRQPYPIQRERGWKTNKSAWRFGSRGKPHRRPKATEEEEQGAGTDTSWIYGMASLNI